MKTAIILIILLVSGIGCRHAGNPPRPFSNEDYAVYRTVLESLIDSSQHFLILVHDSTLHNDPMQRREYTDTTADGKRILHVEHPALFSYTPRTLPSPTEWPQFPVEEFRQEMGSVNDNSSGLDLDSIIVPPGTTLHRSKNMDGAQKGRFFEGRRVFKFWTSRVAFTRSQDQALVYVEYTCGGLCGAGEWIWLQKSALSWRILRRYETWVS